MLATSFEASASIELVGGKGYSLSRLATASFLVPSGRILTTAAYSRFIEFHSIEEELLACSKPDVVSGELSFVAASERAQSLFDERELPSDIRQSIRECLSELGGDDVALAARSSANVEDLPTQSFAGLHSSYLNIRGEDSLTNAILNCWKSLWSERALSYRFQMGVDNVDVAMAVVLQVSLRSDVSGILFTANPVTGNREELLINTSYGLGEAVVSGSVAPDEFVLNRSSCAVKSKRIGSKKLQLVVSGQQGIHEIEVPERLRDQPSLEADQLKEIARNGIEIEALFEDAPQDIEWSIDGSDLWILQSRPITRLPPEPLEAVSWDPPEPGAYLQRSQWVEHVPDPVSTLFEDLHMKRSLQVAWGKNLSKRGHHDFEDTQPPACFDLTQTINGYAYRQVGEPPRTGRVETKARRRVSRLSSLMAKWKIYLLFVPRWRYGALPRYLRQIRHWVKLDPKSASIEQLWKGIRVLSQADAAYWFNNGVWNAFSLSRGTEIQLHQFLQESELTSGHLLSGLKSATYRSQKQLFDICCLIHRESKLFNQVVRTPPHQLLSILEKTSEGKQVIAAIERYFEAFGHQLSTLDFSVPTTREKPTDTLRSLHTFLLRPELDPETKLNQVKQSRREATRSAWKYFRGRQKLRFLWRLWVARLYYPNREEAMFHLGRAWTVLRPLALELGRRLTLHGTLNRREDVFYLTTDELGRAIRSMAAVSRLTEEHRTRHYPDGPGIPEYAALAEGRRALQQRRKALNPPYLIPGPPPWAPLTDFPQESGSIMILTGSPVSPGSVTGKARIILSSSDFGDMKFGDILVCPTTTPTWTQLFPQASALVTDIGGILAHGSIVAREFGIPAVLGLGDATTKIRNGQTIKVDGNAGTVELMD